MKSTGWFGSILICAAFSLSCSSVPNPFSGNGAPTLFPIIQVENGSSEKFGYIDSKGEVVIQPQFTQAWFFSEGLAAACIDHNKCGYIDETGKFAINPQFQYGGRFSEGLAAVAVEGKLGYVDRAGKYVINPQFQMSGGDGALLSFFSEGLANIRIGDQVGFIDREGKIVINPQFKDGWPFTEGLSAVRIGEKWGFVDREGKIIVNPQFESAHPFVNGVAAVKVGNQWGYIDKAGKIVINPQFDFAAPFAKEGVALVFLKDKAGYIDRQGTYVVNPQYDIPKNRGPGNNAELVFLAWIITPDLGRLSFSEGFALANIGSAEKPNFGYADSSGKIVINPQFSLAFPFFGDLALVMLNERDGFAWIDKSGKIVWKLTKETDARASANANRAVSNAMNAAANSANTPANRPSTITRTGRLTTDSNIRSESNKEATSLGIHFKGAKLRILEETSYTLPTGELSTWYKVRVTDYGCSVNANLGCGKDPNTSDEGWVNAKNVLID